MDELPGESISAAIQKLAAWIGREPAFRAGLRAAAQLILDATAQPAESRPEAEAAAGDAPSAEPPIEAVPELPRPAPVRSPERTVPLPPLTLGQPQPPRPAIIELPASLLTRPTHDEPDPLNLIATRARLKAAATRWAAKQGGSASSLTWADDSETLRDWQARARELPGCVLWMLPPNAPPLAAQPQAAEHLALGFEVLAEAAELLEGWLHEADRRPHAHAVLQLAAEAQSALRVAVEDVGGHRDSDQVAVYQNLRDRGRDMRVFIERFMRLDDPADPRTLPALRRRIADQTASLVEARTGARQQRKQINRIKYHANRIHDGDGDEHDWRTIAQTAAEAVRDGLPPSSPELREVLLPIFDSMPELDGLPEEFDLVYREIDRFLALQQKAQDNAEVPVEEPATAEVRQVAELLRDRTVVFIGGEARPHNVRRLEEAFGLASLDWITTRDHQSIAPFEAHIARREVALVIVAIRWSNHSFEGVKAFCQDHGKPLLRLKAGYSPNQVAAQVLLQCSQQLMSLAAPP